MASVSASYFGYADAALETDDTIRANHLLRRYEGEVKSYDREDGRQIIVGIKGSGKTDLRRYIEQIDDEALVLNLDANNALLNIDASEYAGRSGRMKSGISLLILQAFAENVVVDEESGALKQRLRKTGGWLQEKLENIPDAVEVDAPGVSVNPRELFKSRSASVVQTTWQGLAEQIESDLQDRRGYIFIDDAEDVFLGLESEPVFLEAVARSVNDLNRRFERSLHALLFLKHGVWRTWYENQQEYDKVRYTIIHISWDHETLVQLLAKRIAAIHGEELEAEPPEGRIEELWSKEFEWSGKFERFTDTVTKYCVGGPRDIIELANSAKKDAGAEKITVPNLENVLRNYSEDKVNELSADFGDVYPDVHRFVEMVFQSAPGRMSGKEMADWLEEKALIDDQVQPAFSENRWFAFSSKSALTKKMYLIGLCGMEKADGIVYAMECPNASTREIMDSDLVIHPAFRPYLNVTG